MGRDHGRCVVVDRIGKTQAVRDSRTEGSRRDPAGQGICRPSGTDKGANPYREIMMEQTGKKGEGRRDRPIGSSLPEVGEVDATLVQGGVDP